MKIIVLLLMGILTLSVPCQVGISFDVERDPPAANYNIRSFDGVKKIPEILKILDKHGTKSTFFINGEVAYEFPEVVRQIHERGHETAVHGGYYHDQPMKGLTKEEQKAAILETRTMIKGIIRETPTGYRAPGHAIDTATVAALEELDFAYDSSVVPSVAGWYLYKHPLYAPDFPYRPNYSDPFRTGEMTLKEVPITPVFLNGNLDSLLAFQGKAITKIELLVSVFKCKLERKPLIIYLHPGMTADLPNGPLNYRAGSYLLEEFDDILYFLDRMNVKYVTIKDI